MIKQLIELRDVISLTKDKVGLGAVNELIEQAKTERIVASHEVLVEEVDRIADRKHVATSFAIGKAVESLVAKKLVSVRTYGDNESVKVFIDMDNG
ncbi:MAG: hypothetical protein ACEPOW_13810 [Bacteroidales bacterium]